MAALHKLVTTFQAFLKVQTHFGAHFESKLELIELGIAFDKWESKQKVQMLI